LKNYKKGKLDGEYISYYSNRIIKRKEKYRHGKFINGNCYSISGQDTTFFPRFLMASFPGGNNELNKYIISNLKYPKEALKQNIYGKVFVSFVINKEGEVEDIKVIKGVNFFLDRSALDVVKNMPKWIPGRQDGVPVKMLFTIPISFKI
jgi:TonB family protein